MNITFLTAGIILMAITFFSVDIAGCLPFAVDIAGTDITSWLVSSAINAGAWILILSGIFGKSSGGGSTMISSLINGFGRHSK